MEKIATMVKCGTNVIKDHIVVLPTAKDKHVFICDEAYQYINQLEAEVYRLRLACEEGLHEIGSVARYGRGYLALMQITSFNKEELNYYGLTVEGSKVVANMSLVQKATPEDLIVWNRGK